MNRHDAELLPPEMVVGEAPAGWDELVRNLGGTVFHSTHWAKFKRVTQRLHPVYFVQHRHDGTPTAAALALLEKSRHPLLSRLFRDLELCAHPCSRGDAAALGAFLTRCEAHVRRLGCRRLTLSSFMSGTSPLIPAQHGYIELHRTEFVAALTRPLDELWNAIGKDQRERIRRLDRDGVEVELGDTRAAVEGLRLVRETTQNKRQQRGQEYELPADPVFYDHLFEHLVSPGAGHVFVARQRGQVLAALFFATFASRACSIYSGSTPEGYRMGAQSRLFWAAVEHFRAAGYVELNRGGVPASAVAASDPLHGIYAFKLRLGTTPVLCRSGHKLLSPFRDRMFRLRDRLRAASA